MQRDGGAPGAPTGEGEKIKINSLVNTVGLHPGQPSATLTGPHLGPYGGGGGSPGQKSVPSIFKGHIGDREPSTGAQE